MVLLKIEAEAMARRLSRRGKKEEERKSENQEQVVSWGSGTSGWSGQRA
jgi:deoxyadenosine/deoxycytidine kinase